MLPSTPIAKLALLSASARINCEEPSIVALATRDSGKDDEKKCASRALSGPSEEQGECDAGCCADDVFLLARHWIERSVHELERADFGTWRVPALYENLSGVLPDVDG